MPSFVNALCQRRQQRPGRGRLSVGRQSTAGAPAGRKPLKSRKARNRLLQCPSGAAATLVTLLVPPATVSRAPATSWAGCEWGVHGHRRRRVRGEWLVTITKSVALRTAEERLSAQALIARRGGAGRQVQAACARGRNLCVRGDAQYAIRRITLILLRARNRGHYVGLSDNALRESRNRHVMGLLRARNRFRIGFVTTWHVMGT